MKRSGATSPKKLRRFVIIDDNHTRRDRIKQPRNTSRCWPLANAKGGALPRRLEQHMSSAHFSLFNGQRPRQYHHTKPAPPLIPLASRTSPFRRISVDSSTQAFRQATPSSSQRTVIHSHAGDTRQLTAALRPSGPLLRTPAPIATTVGTTNTDMASLYWATFLRNRISRERAGGGLQSKHQNLIWSIIRTSSERKNAESTAPACLY